MVFQELNLFGNLSVAENIFANREIVRHGRIDHAEQERRTGELMQRLQAAVDMRVGGNSPEAGLWVCTPGKWPLKIPRDEFCHFIAGRATYQRDSGEVIEVTPGTCVHFTAGWTGICTVHETLRNVYMLR